MISLLLVLAQARTDAYAPLDYGKLTRAAVGEFASVSGKGWTAEINVRIEGPKSTDPVFTEQWHEIGEVVATQPLKLRMSRKLIASTLDGDPIPPPDGDPVVWNETPRSESFHDGLPDDPAAYRWARLLAWIPPGEPYRWSARSESRIPPAVTTFVGRLDQGYHWENFTARRVRWKFTENPGIEADGDALLEARTGLPLHTRLTASGVHLPGGDGTQYQVTWVRKTTEIRR